METESFVCIPRPFINHAFRTTAESSIKGVTITIDRAIFRRPHLLVDLLRETPPTGFSFQHCDWRFNLVFRQRPNH